MPLKGTPSEKQIAEQRVLEVVSVIHGLKYNDDSEEVRKFNEAMKNFIEGIRNRPRSQETS